MRVVADRAEERDVGTEPGRRDGGVRPLATGQGLRVTTEDGLAACRAAVGGDHEIGVGGPDDEHLCSHISKSATGGGRAADIPDIVHG